MQVGGQGLLAAGEFRRIGHIVPAGVVVGRGVAAPFGVVGRKLHAAVTLPALGYAVHTGFGVAGRVVDGDFRHRVQRRHLAGGLGIVYLGRGIGLRQAKFLARCVFELFVEERVLVEHLLNFLAQLQRGQLQESDRLLQLRRERQVL